MMKHPIYTDSKIPICTASGIHGPQISEWVIMTTLVQSHRYNALYELQKKHVWDRGEGSNGIRDLAGQRLGVLGYGSIGRQGELRVKSWIGPHQTHPSHNHNAALYDIIDIR
jgi:phosphoglycerate dehydrogenase-like enzyme